MKKAQDYLNRAKRHPFDESTKPEWGIGPDGKHVKIADDIRFAGLFSEWQADACEHERTGIIRWVNGGAQTCYNWFCAHCGTKLSSNIPHAAALDHGVVDREDANLDSMASRHNTYHGERSERLKALTSAAAERAQPNNREGYADYLRTERWRDLRLRILRRAAGLCEGCLEAPAEQVHHLSYAHRGAEFAFELIALCEPCHERWHKDEAA